MALNLFSYWLYGDEYLQEAWLYHLIRKDNRHNYSVYFHLIYQLYEQSGSQAIALAMFIPQWSLIIVAGLLFHHDLFFAMVVQTWAFVAFNKVYTAQYFLWYLSLLPFVAINNSAIHGSGCRWIIGLTIYAAQSLFVPLWEVTAYKLEFQGLNAFNEIQWANYIFFVINIVSLVVVIKCHVVTVTFEMQGEYTVGNMEQAVWMQRALVQN